MRYYGFFAILAVFALLSGCATVNFKKISGANLHDREGGHLVQEQWENETLSFYLPEIEEMAVAYVPVPKSAQEKWREEFIYYRESNSLHGKKSLSRLTRWVFRSLVYCDGNLSGVSGVFDAVLNKDRNNFMLLFPSEFKYGEGCNVAILSSNGKWLMTMDGSTIEINMPEQKSIKETPNDLFHDHPSTLSQAVRVKRKGDPVGKKLFRELEEMFPKAFPNVYRAGWQSARIETEYNARKFAGTETPLKRFIACGSLTLGPAIINPIGAGITLGPQAVHDVNIMFFKENCEKK